MFLIEGLLSIYIDVAFTNPSMEIFVCLQLCRSADNAIYSGASIIHIYRGYDELCIVIYILVTVDRIELHLMPNFVRGRSLLLVVVGLGLEYPVYESGEWTHTYSDIVYSIVVTCLDVY